MFYASFDLEEIYTELVSSQKAKGRLSTDWHNTCISVYYPVCLSSCLPACLPVCLAGYLSVYRFTCLSAATVGKAEWNVGCKYEFDTPK